jgi:HAD superfamily hydrolase (TIGR01484 family)
MEHKPKLAIFDVDGTIAEHGSVPQSVIDGIRHLQSWGCITTVSTGRGYIRLKEMLGDHFDTIISPEALLILEHGTKITDRTGQVIFGEFFSDREIDHVVDFTRSNVSLFKLVWYNPEDASEKVQVCCLDERDLDGETQKRGHYANVFTCSIGELEELLLKQHLTNVTLKLKDYVKVENLKLAFTRTDTNVIFQDGNMEFVKSNINKGLAVDYVAKHLQINSDDILTAGNAINDIEMLDAGSGITVLVGNQQNRETILSYLSNQSEIVSVESPEELGNYLVAL